MYINTNIGIITIDDYKEMRAIQNGFDSYEDMLFQGYDIDIDDDCVISNEYMDFIIGYLKLEKDLKELVVKAICDKNVNF